MIFRKTASSDSEFASQWNWWKEKARNIWERRRQAWVACSQTRKTIRWVCPMTSHKI